MGWSGQSRPDPRNIERRAAMAASETKTNPTTPAVVLYPDNKSMPGPIRRVGTLSTTKAALVIADLLMVAIALVAAAWINSSLNPGDPTSRAQYTGLALVSLPLWPITFTQQLLYRARYLTRHLDEVVRVIRAVAIGMLLTGGLSILVKVDIGRQWLIIAGSLVMALMATERLIARSLFDRARRNGSMLRPVLIAGRNAEGKLVRDMLQSDPSLGYKFEGFVEDIVETEPGESPLALLGDPSKVIHAIEVVGSSSIIIAATAIDIGTSNRLIRALTEYGVHVELSSTLCDIAANRLTIRPVGRMPMMYIEPVMRTGWRPLAKRLFDLIVASVGLLLVSPIIIVAALAIKFSSSGPVMFRQPRVGCDGNLFEMIKLRTMVIEAEDLLADLLPQTDSTGLLFKMHNDPRVTRVGRFLRKLSIDELPQLINVVRGEMSLVGPRPALPRETEGWNKELHNRLRVRPGITGMWQVKGRSDTDHDSLYAQLDLYYVDNWSLLTDLAILARTIPVVLSSKGQY